jgi:large subunit ribosomal protein LP2
MFHLSLDCCFILDECFIFNLCLHDMTHDIELGTTDSIVNMQEIAAYLLLFLGGNETPSVDDIKGLIVTAGNEDPSEDKITSLLGDLEGKSVNDLLSDGMSKLKDVPMGGGGGGGGAVAAPSSSAPAAAAPKEEEKKEEEEEMDLGGGMDMFGGSGGGGGGDY